ncbi:TRAP transporter substrate-binding protein [Algihabitans albus]|uniref:TRAP transporter substrate-binding protein n=1 Tax=Algihabitans albus TaxID=2164067 RepID=UPI000E5C8942|nr:TRAP transporter substrate-binding protein [Algihabitans albus]
MKRALALAAVTVLSVTALSAASLPAQAQEAKLGHLAPTGDPRHEVLTTFAEAVETGTGGAVAIDVFPDSTLGKERELFEQVQAGITEFALVGSVVANFYPAWSIIDMPFLWRDREHLVAFVNSDFAKDWSADMAAQFSVDMLAFLERNPRILTSTKKPVRSVADLEGTKVRVPNINVYTDTWRAFGVEPVPMPASDFYLALRLGTIEGMENPVEVMYHWKIHEVSEYLMLTEHMRSGFYLIASKRFMDGLSDEHRGVVREAAAAAQAMMAEKNAEGAANLYGKLEEAGMTIVRDIDIGSFRERAAPVHELYMDQFGRDAYDAAVKLAN